MNLTCPKCKKVIQLSPEKIPQDKEKAMIKCPSCQQVIVFNVPKIAGQPPIQKKEDKTIIGGIISNSFAVFNTKLIETATNTEHKLNIGKNVIGRIADVSIDNGDKFISRKHCMIEVVERAGNFEIILTDDGSISDSGEPSTNGTFYNNSRLTKYDKIYLNIGDKITIGHTELKLI